MPFFICVTGLCAVACGLVYGAVVASSAGQWLAVGAMMTVGVSLLVVL